MSFCYKYNVVVCMFDVSTECVCECQTCVHLKLQIQIEHEQISDAHRLAVRNRGANKGGLGGGAVRESLNGVDTRS